MRDRTESMVSGRKGKRNVRKKLNNTACKYNISLNPQGFKISVYYSVNRKPALCGTYSGISINLHTPNIIPIVIIKQSKLFYNFTMVNADRYKQIVQRGLTDIGLYCLSKRY